MPDERNAMCLTGTSQSNTFQEYLTACRTNDDSSRANNFFTDVNNNFKSTFESLKAEYDNLITMGNGTNDLATLSGTTITQTDGRLSAFTKKKDLLLAEIKAVKAQGEAADRSFMNEIVNGNPQGSSVPSLQDISLLLFWFAWIVMVVVLLGVRFSSGGIKGLLVTFVVLFLVTIAMYALLLQLA